MRFVNSTQKTLKYARNYNAESTLHTSHDLCHHSNVKITSHAKLQTSPSLQPHMPAPLNR